MGSTRSSVAAPPLSRYALEPQAQAALLLRHEQVMLSCVSHIASLVERNLHLALASTPTMTASHANISSGQIKVHLGTIVGAVNPASFD